jgi:hypothetical protein
MSRDTTLVRSSAAHVVRAMHRYGMSVRWSIQSMSALIPALTIAIVTLLVAMSLSRGLRKHFEA